VHNLRKMSQESVGQSNNSLDVISRLQEVALDLLIDKPCAADTLLSKIWKKCTKTQSQMKLKKFLKAVHLVRVKAPPVANRGKRTGRIMNLK